MKQTTAALTVASVALATDMLVYGIAIPVLPYIARELDASPAAIGVLFGSQAVALLVATPWVGRWVDRSGPRAPLQVGLLGLAAATVLFAFSSSFEFLVLARVLQGIAAAVSWTAGLALIAATHPPELRGRAMGTALAAMSVGVLLGPPVGGVLFEHFGARAPFLFAAVVAVGDAAARWLLIRELPHAPREQTPWSLLRAPDARMLLMLTALGALLLAFLEPVLPLHLSSVFGSQPGTVGLLFGVATLVSSIMYPIVGKVADRVSRLTVVGAGALLGMVAVLALAVSPGVWTAGLSLSVVAIAAGAILAPSSALSAEMAEAVQPPAYGAAYALYNLSYAAGLALGPLLAGPGYGALGFRGVMWVFAGVLFLAGISALIAARRKSKSGRTHPPRPYGAPPAELEREA